MIAVFFIILFIAVPVIELWLILQVGEMIGVMPTILLLLLDSLLGAWLVKSQGGAVWRNFRKAVDAGRIPANEAVDGFLVIMGGTLLLVPGFLSDIVGILLIAPPSRKLLRGRVVRFGMGRTRATFMGGFVADDTGMRDFAKSDQPRGRTTSTQGEREPEFDFETHQLHE
ncbi:MAG: FxsA family protein [Thermoleophilaceae bacterium]|nr:FxsA family protein [Thermoleophilaceae bacterium]